MPTGTHSLSTWFRRARDDRRGSVAVIFALMLIPILLAVGMAIDLTRQSNAQSAFQSTVDAAALAGATVYTSTTTASTASQVASRYFVTNKLPTGVTLIGTPTIVAQAGTMYNGQNSYNVTVTANATISTTFMSIAKFKTLNLNATATAGNPLLQAKITVGPTGSFAADFNSVFMYPIPMGSNNLPDYTAFPPASSFYQISSNCNSGNGDWNSNAKCNGEFASVIYPGQTIPVIPATTPLAFAFVNQTNAAEQATVNSGYRQGYGNTSLNYEFLFSAPLSIGKSPTLYANNPSPIYNLANYFTGFGSQTQANTTYPTADAPAASNCALQITVVDPNNLPTNPPYPGVCLSPTDPRSGFQYANLSCNQMAGRTFEYWWNDMGGYTDDKDYKNMYYTVSCIGAGNLSTSNSGNPPTGNPSTDNSTTQANYGPGLIK